MNKVNFIHKALCYIHILKVLPRLGWKSSPEKPIWRKKWNLEDWNWLRVGGSVSLACMSQRFCLHGGPMVSIVASWYEATRLKCRLYADDLLPPDQINPNSCSSKSPEELHVLWVFYLSTSVNVG